MEETRSRLRSAGKQAGGFLTKVAWGSCKCVFWTCCGPCFLCALCFRPRRQRGACTHLYDINLNPPRPVTPPPRSRALTLPLVKPEKNQLTSDQRQSAFMTKLPLEVRRLVYSEMLGGAIVHLETTDGKARARRCNRSMCQCVVFCPPMEQKLDLPLAVLQTCRKIYSEAVEYLYTDNSFSLTTIFDEYPSVDYLSYYFLPQRLAQIRTLCIYWELESIHYNKTPGTIAPDLSAWTKSWAALKQMSGLRQLHIVIGSRSRPWSDLDLQHWEAVGPEILLDVQTVTAPCDFTITLPDRGCSTALDVGDSKCVFRLPAEALADTNPT